MRALLNVMVCRALSAALTCASALGALVLVALCLATTAATAAEPPPGLSPAEREVFRGIKARIIREVTKELADDRLEGRGTLQRGGEKAAAWIAERMKTHGLAPGGEGGTYLQQVPLVATDFVEPTRVSVDGTALTYGTDWSTIGAVADLHVSPPLVFAGHGMVSKKFGRDDLKDVDLKGKFVVTIEGRPADVTPEKWAELSEDAKLLPTLFARGIAGLIVIPNGREALPRAFIIDQTARRKISMPSAGAPGSIPLMLFGAAAAERLLGGPAAMKQALDEADGAAFTPRTLAAKVDIQFKLEKKEGTSPNVIGVIKGSDPALAAEAVVFTAHYDGFGVIRNVIYNGAADNAIGVGEMLAVAEAFARAKVKPRRSLVFIAFTAEEYGLLGSRHYVAHPTWDLARTAAVLNLDGIGTEIMGPMKSMVAYGAAFSSLGPLFFEVARAYGITPMDDPIPEQGVFRRSDHYSFVERGVPGLMLVGAPVDTPKAFSERFDEFERTKYHQPSDDVYRDWYWKGARKVADMMALVGHRVAQADTMPSFNADTEFAGRPRGEAPKPTASGASPDAGQAGAPPWGIANGQPDAGLYVPRDVQQAYAKGTRSPDGRPGPNYWQNEADHRIRISLSPPSRRVQGEQDIVYTNNSPDPLSMLVFRLYMDAHRAEAMREKTVDARFMTDGITIEELSIDGKAIAWNDPANPLASYNTPGSTIHALQLGTPIPPRSSVRIRMRWHYDLVADSGWKEGAIDETTYFLAYFFPRITNYSDYNAWDVTPFTLGREFNNDFADFQVEVDVPRDYVVWATGTLQNPAEVLQPAVHKQLESSFTSDTVVTLAEAADVKAGKVTARGERLTWKWRADHVPDFAIAVSNNYRWDAASTVVDPATGRRASVQAAYADSATDFRPMVASAQQTLRLASTTYPGVPYPYPKTTVVLGSADEEYPMMVNDGSNVGSPSAASLPENAFTAFVAAHEILHTWFPFYMGINEKRYPFMDEGWTTAFEYLRNREVLGVPTADAQFKSFRTSVLALPLSGFDLPIITPHDSLWGQTPIFGFNQYGKAALGYLALRDLMGDAAFRKALQEFMARWNGKRPLPWDMFNSFNDAGVGNFTWFFQNWFFGYNHIDVAVGAVRSEGGGQTVTVRNPGGMAVPFDLVLDYADGSSERVHRTPAAWQADGRKTDVQVAGGKALRSVTLDTGIFVDANPGDNTWAADKAGSR